MCCATPRPRPAADTNAPEASDVPAVFSDPYFILCACIAVTVTGVMRGGFGSGIGGFAVPIMSLAIPPQQAAAIALPVLIASDVFGLYLYRMNLDWRVMRIIVPAGLVGTALGWWLFWILDDAWIKLFLGVISVAFVLHSIARRSATSGRPGPAQGYLWGTVAGLTSFVAHAGGPPLVIYMLGQRLAKEVFVSTTMTFFMMLNLAKIVPYVQLGLLDMENVATSALLIPVLLVGLALGQLLNKWMSPTWFFRSIVGLLFVTGVKLTYDGSTALLARL